MSHGITRVCLPAVLAALLAVPAIPAENPPAAVKPAAPPVAPAEAPSALADVARLLVKREYIAQVHADSLVAAEGADPARAVVNLARILAARGHLSPSAVDAVVALAASPGGGASSRALSELVRVLLESHLITDAELEALQTPDGVRRLTYVPELVRAQIRDQVKRDILEQMKKENWASPKAFPEWTKRFTFKGDVRARYERDVFKQGNAALGEFPDYNAINNGSPVDVLGVDVAPDRFLNVDQNRSRPRLRARLGLDARVNDGVTAVLRVASGDGSAPVSTNQTLGGSGGSFSKYQIWLDRAAVRWSWLKGSQRNLTLDVGRFANPFFATDLVWDEDLNMDGLALEADMALPGDLRGFFAGGVFPVYNSAFAFPAEMPDKFQSWDRWLYAAQLGARWGTEEGTSLKLGAAIYAFQGVKGRVSSPCDTHVKGVSCDTDITRPAFAQKGNTYRELRTRSPDAVAAEDAAPNSTPRYQYFGLASEFRTLAITGRLDAKVHPRMRLSLEGEYAQNLALRRGSMSNVNNNTRPCDEGYCPYGGGGVAYLGRLSLGSPTASSRGDWNAWLAYRYLESDALLDAFNDSDFGLGGTNMKGFNLGVTVCPVDNLTLGLRWYSADEVMGPQLGVNVYQLDLNARF